MNSIENACTRSLGFPVALRLDTSLWPSRFGMSITEGRDVAISLNTSGYSLRRKNGFTLIELLVVVAIIGILIMLTAPLLGRGLEKSRVATCMQNLRSLHSAMYSYAAGHDGLMPTYAIMRSSRVPELQQFMGSPDKAKSVWLCPSDTMVEERAKLNSNTSDPAEELYSSYGVVHAFLPKRATLETGPDYNPYYNLTNHYSILVSFIERPSAAIFMADGGRFDIVNNSISVKHQCVQFRHGRPSEMDDMEINPQNSNWSARGYDTKGKFASALANVVFYDGHAASMNYAAYCQYVNWFGKTNKFTDRAIAVIPSSEYE